MTDEAHFPRQLHAVRFQPNDTAQGAYDQDRHWVLPGPVSIGSECIYDREAFQARLIASYNACEGIAVEALEAGVIERLLHAARTALAAHCEDEEEACWKALASAHDEATGGTVMTTKSAAECEHLEDMVRWLSECCEAGILYDFDGTGKPASLCIVCRDWTGFNLVCECGATVTATGEAA